MPRKPCKPSHIPAEIRNAAAVALAAEEDARRALWQKAEKDQRCQDAVKAFGEATQALWKALPDQPRPLLRSLHTALLSACEALVEVGRLESWGRIDHERTYDRYRLHNGRVMSEPSYEWARQLLDDATAGRLSEGSLAETWEEESLRDAIRWLSLLIFGLSGEGPVLPEIQGQLLESPTATDRDQSEAGQGEGGAPNRGQQRPKQGGAVMSNRSNDEPRSISPPPSDPCCVLSELLSEAESRRQQEDEARRIEAARARRQCELQALRRKLEDAFDLASDFAREETEQGRQLCSEAFGRWAERFVDLGRILRECDAAVDGLRLVEQLHAVVRRPAPAPMRFACVLLLLASQDRADAVASALVDAKDHRELRRFVHWLGFILDNLWHPLPGEDGIIQVVMPPDGTSQEERAQAGQAFGWGQPGRVAEPPAQPLDNPDAILSRCEAFREQQAKFAREAAAASASTRRTPNSHSCSASSETPTRCRPSNPSGTRRRP
jgi:hypothetical protein